MKPTDKKTEFVRLRAEGKSYRAIEKELGVSRSTCSAWEKELREEVNGLRHDNLEELYTSYGMAREARIQRIGDTLRRIDEALAQADLTKLTPEKLLDYKLKYSAALREEYNTATAEATGEAQDTLEAIQDLYRRTASGDTTAGQAKTELSILNNMAEEYNRANPFSIDNIF
jgi:hypothetical protein